MMIRFEDAAACSAFQERLQAEEPDLARLAKVSYTQPEVLLLLGANAEAHARIAGLCAGIAQPVADLRFETLPDA